MKALNKDNVSLTKDCSTQVELEATIPTDNQNTDVQGDNKKLEEIEETEKTPKKVFKQTLFIRLSKIGRLLYHPVTNKIFIFLIIT